MRKFIVTETLVHEYTIPQEEVEYMRRLLPFDTSHWSDEEIVQNFYEEGDLDGHITYAESQAIDRATVEHTD